MACNIVISRLRLVRNVCTKNEATDLSCQSTRTNTSKHFKEQYSENFIVPNLRLRSVQRQPGWQDKVSKTADYLFSSWWKAGLFPHGYLGNERKGNEKRREVEKGRYWWKRVDGMIPNWVDSVYMIRDTIIWVSNVEYIGKRRNAKGEK